MKVRPSFLGQNRPLNTCMIQAATPDAALCEIRNAIFDGADAFGFQACRLRKEFRSEETYRGIFNAMQNRPVYVTNYRFGENQGMSDEERMDGFALLIKSGATLVDVPGDTYMPSPFELALSPLAVNRQKATMERFHAMGAETLMSSHVMKFLPAEEVLRIALAHQERGADISKIVTGADSEEEELENLRITALLRRELKIPFLFLSAGKHNQLHRLVGPALGSAMWLTVARHNELSTKVQPICHAVRDLARILPL